MKNKGGKKDENSAFYSNDSGKDQKGGSSLKKNIECYNCGKKGHYKKDCWNEGGGKEGQGPKQKGKGKGKGKGKEKEKETAASTSTEEKKDDKSKDSKKVEEAWMAMVFDEGSENNGCDHCDSYPDHEVAYSCFIEDETPTISPSESDLDISEFLENADVVFDTDHDPETVPDETKARTGIEYAYLVGTRSRGGLI